MKRGGPARLLFPALRWSAERGYEQEAAAIEQALRLGVGGFCIFGGTAEAVAELTWRTQSRCDHALLFGADLERGAGQQFQGATALPPLAALGSLADLEATRRAGELTAREARALGINWIYGPSADLDLEPRNPIVGTRAFGGDAQQVAAQVRAWIDGCQDAGGVACAKHFPGHGRTVEDSHASLPRVDASRVELERDLEPFRAAIAAGVGSIMTAHVVYPALDPGANAATISPVVLRELLREQLRFEGVIATDALMMRGLLAAVGGDESAAAVAALRAGCDALLYPGDAARVAAALDGAVGSVVARARVEEAGERVAALAERAAPSWGYRPAAADAAWAAEVALASVHRLTGQPSCPPGVELLTIDDDTGGPHPAPAREAFAATLAEQGIVARPVREASGAFALLVAVYADVRAWKERPGLSAEAAASLRRALERRRDATVVLFGHPRLAEDLGALAVVCAWGGEPLMQRAAGQWLAAHASRTVL